jgi:hypothetical protein
MWMRYGEPLLAARWHVEGGEGTGMLQAESVTAPLPKEYLPYGRQAQERRAAYAATGMTNQHPPKSRI